MRMKKIFNPVYLQTLLLYSLLFLFFLAILPEASFVGDMNFWREWTGWIHEHGIENIYNYKTEYHPFFLYCLGIFQWFMGSMAEVKAHLNYIKVFPLLFDFIGALSVFFILKEEKNKIIYPLFLLFNIGYMYNTMLWGQIDSIHTTFVLLSLIFTLKERPYLGIIFFVLALNTKLQAIIYLPIIGLLLLPHFTRSYRFILKSIGLLILVQLLILLPFIFSGSISGFWKVIAEAEGRHPHVSMNAYNLWYFFFENGVNLAKIVDTNEFLIGLSFKTWGFILFFFFSTVSLIPLLKNSFQWIKNKAVPNERFMELVFLTGGLITLVFFYFNTQMHERYSHSAIILFFFYGIKSKRYLLFILSSFAITMNMESVLKVWKIDNYGTLIFDQDFIAGIFLIIILVSIFRLYKSYFKYEQKELISSTPST